MEYFDLYITNLSINSNIYFFFSAWTSKPKMFRRILPCWICVAKRNENDISRSCSLEFQSVMQILTKCMLRWDTKTQSSQGKGILGMVLAFSGANEEQGRKTLHWHWQIWVQELNQTLWDCLFDTDATKKKMHKKHSANISTMLLVQVMDLI